MKDLQCQSFSGLSDAFKLKETLIDRSVSLGQEDGFKFFFKRRMDSSETRGTKARLKLVDSKYKPNSPQRLGRLLRPYDFYLCSISCVSIMRVDARLQRFTPQLIYTHGS